MRTTVDATMFGVEDADRVVLEKLVQQIAGSSLIQNGHWFTYHFERWLFGGGHPFAEDIVEACLVVNRTIPNFASEFIDALAAIHGPTLDKRQYEQLMQRLAELLVILRIVLCAWPSGTSFEFEPTAAGSKKNPELTITSSNYAIGIEVKAPSLLDHIEKRSAAGVQMPARGPWKDVVSKLGDHVTWPRDYPVRDFLRSADAKLRSFKAADPTFIGVLVTVWDDFAYEPISSLLATQSGLFTANSWDVDESGHRRTYSNVDAVIVVPLLQQLMHAAGDRPLHERLGGLDYGAQGSHPLKVVVPNPNASCVVPDALLQCLDARAVSSDLGAEYIPNDVVLWLPAGGGDDPGTA